MPAQGQLASSSLPLALVSSATARSVEEENDRLSEQFFRSKALLREAERQSDVLRAGVDIGEMDVEQEAYLQRIHESFSLLELESMSLQAQVARLKATAATHRTEKASWQRTATRLRAENLSLSGSLSAPDGLSSIELQNRRLSQELDGLGGKHMQATVEVRILQQQVDQLKEVALRSAAARKRLEGESEKLNTYLMQLISSPDGAPEPSSTGDDVSLGPLGFHLVNLKQRLKRADEERDSDRKHMDAFKSKAYDLDRTNNKLQRAHRRAEMEVTTLQAQLKQVRGAASCDQQELAIVKQYLAEAMESQQRIEHDHSTALATASGLRYDAREAEALRKALGDATAEHLMLSKRTEYSVQCTKVAEAEQDRLMAETVKLKYALGQAEEDRTDANSLAKKNALEVEELLGSKRDLFEKLSVTMHDLETAIMESDRDAKQTEFLSRSLRTARGQVSTLEQQLVQLGQTAQTLQKEIELTQARNGREGGGSGNGGSFRTEQLASENRALSKRAADLAEEVADLEEAKIQAEDMANKANKDLQMEVHGAQELMAQVTRLSESLTASAEDKRKLQYGWDEVNQELDREAHDTTKLREALDHAEAWGDTQRQAAERAELLLGEFDAATRRSQDQKTASSEALCVERERRAQAERAHQDLSKQHSALKYEEQTLQDRLHEATRKAHDLDREMNEMSNALVVARADLSNRNSTLEQAHICMERLEQQLAEQKSQVGQANSRQKLEYESMERIKAEHANYMRARAEEEASKAKKLREAEGELVKQRDALRGIHAEKDALAFERRKSQVEATEAEDRLLTVQRRLKFTEEKGHDEARRSQSAANELDAALREVAQVRKELAAALKALSEGMATHEADTARLSKEKSEHTLTSDRLRASQTNVEAGLKTAHQLDVDRVTLQMRELRAAKDALQDDSDRLRKDLRAAQLHLEESRSQTASASTQLGLRVSAQDKELAQGQNVIAQQDADLQRVANENVEFRRKGREARTALDNAVTTHRQELNQRVMALQISEQKLTALRSEHERLQESERQLQRKADEGALILDSLQMAKVDDRERMETLDREHKSSWATLVAGHDTKVLGLRRQLDHQDLQHRKVELEAAASSGRTQELTAQKSDLDNAYQTELSKVNQLLSELQAVNGELKATVSSLKDQQELYRSQLAELRTDKSKATEARESSEGRLRAGERARQELQTTLAEAQVELVRRRVEATSAEQEKHHLVRSLDALQSKHDELYEECTSFTETERQQQRLLSQKELDTVRLESQVERAQDETAQILQLKAAALDRVAELEAGLKEATGKATGKGLELQRIGSTVERLAEQNGRLEASLQEAKGAAAMEKSATTATSAEQVTFFIALLSQLYE
jgi:chromosome segregation ATPase